MEAAGRSSMAGEGHASLSSQFSPEDFGGASSLASAAHDRIAHRPGHAALSVSTNGPRTAIPEPPGRFPSHGPMVVVWHCSGKKRDTSRTPADEGRQYRRGRAFVSLPPS